MSKSRLKIVKNKRDLWDLISHCKTTGYCSFDYETSDTEYINPDSYPLCLGVSFQPGCSWVIPLAHRESSLRKKRKWKRYLRLFGSEVLGNPDITKIAWNLKFEYNWCLRYNIRLRGRLFDGMLAKYCLDEERPHDLKSMVDKFFPEFSGYEGWSEGIKWVDKPLDGLMKYCGIDADLTLRLYHYFEPRLIKGGFYNLFRNLLMTAVRPLAEAEYRGTIIDEAYLSDLVKTYKQKIEESEKKLRGMPALVKFEKKNIRRKKKDLLAEIRLEIAQIEEESASNDKEERSKITRIKNREKKITNIMAGVFNKKEQEKLEPLNFGSPKQLIDFLYLKKYGLRLPIIKFTKNKDTKKPTETPATDEETLETLQAKDKSGFIKQLLIHRGLTKLDSTYVSGMLKNIDRYGRVHTSFLIHGTVTGRLSSREPNLQNIPRDTTASDIKRMFIPPPGYVLLEVDYSQAELRVVAELAKDEVMIDIFKRNYNIHVATACLLNGGLHLYDQVKGILKDPKHKDNLKWEKEKKKAKTVNFGILYGQSAKALAEDIGISTEEAQDFINRWLKNYPGVRKWMKNQINYCRKHGYVKNMFGRKRRLQDIDSDYKGFREKAERDCINAPIQGTASDFTLFSQVVIRHEIMKGNLPIDMYQVYTVHDSRGCE
jgi:DNA polymerase I-like protein with 3'-5' exonuclease and polymerase domains